MSYPRKKLEPAAGVEPVCLRHTKTVLIRMSFTG